MGFLNNQVVTIDAILTKKGRELLARGDGSYNITQFALSDDEIDYTQYNPNHPSGSAFYGEAIENMPLLEAFPDELQIMKYKLTTLPRGTSKMPILDLGQSSLILSQTAMKSIKPQTLNYLGATSIFESAGYSFTISDIRLFSSFNAEGVNNDITKGINARNSTNNSSRIATNGTNVSRTVNGTTLNITATGVNTLFGSNQSLQATLTVVGLDSGARIQIPVTINKTATLT